MEGELRDVLTYGLKCPTCERAFASIIEQDREAVWKEELSTNVLKLVHTACTGSQLFICRGGCGKTSKRKPSQIKCQCAGNGRGVSDAEAMAAASPDAAFDSFSDTDMGTSSQDAGDDTALDEEGQRAQERHMEEQKVEEHFNDTRKFPPQMAKYFTREYYQPGSGKVGLVYNALVDAEVTSETSGLSMDETNYHLHVAASFYKMPQSSVHDVAAMSRQIVKDGIEDNKSESNMLSECFTKSFREVLRGTVPAEHIDELMGRVHQSVEAKVGVAKEAKPPPRMINHPTDYNTIRNRYLEGRNSIVQQAPVPEVKMMDGFAYIPVMQILTYILALGTPLRTYQRESDWTDEGGGYAGTHGYAGSYYSELHDRVKSLREEDPDIWGDVRVHLLRAWSDAYEAFQIKVNNERNSLQLYTITIAPPRGCGYTTKRLTLPFALGFKKKDHSSILNELLTMISEVDGVPLDMYCGKEKRIVTVAFFFHTISNDYPERCDNSGVSQKGKYTKRWGYSCLFDRISTPSCSLCERSRIGRIMKQDTENQQREGQCSCCSDWWSTVIHDATKYPTDPWDAQDANPPVLKLNFNILRSAFQSAQDYYLLYTNEDDSGKPPSKKPVQEFMARCGVGKNISDKAIEGIWNGQPIEELLPTILKHSPIHGYDLDRFGPTPMHQNTLGCEKSLIPLTPSLFNRRYTTHNRAWKSLFNSITSSHKAVTNASIGWCKAAPFSKKEALKLGTGKWQSEHYLAFTRVSLVHFVPLDDMNLDDMHRKVLGVFKAVRVLWFCIMSYTLTDVPGVSSERLHDFIKLFLSACNRLHYVSIAAKEKRSGRKRSADAEERENDNEKDDNEEDETYSSLPFFASKSNFFSLLNAKDDTDRHGRLGDLWEGYMEAYIQLLKNETSVMRHSDEFMVTILSKLLRTSFLDHANEGNPYTERSRYARTFNFRVYPHHTNMKGLFSNSSIPCGVIIDGKMYLCQDSFGRSSGVTLMGIRFNDNTGQWRYNLWYASCELDPIKRLICRDREEIVKRATDFFAMFPMTVSETSQVISHTVLCKSWRVRDELGGLSLPIPREGALDYFKNEL